MNQSFIEIFSTIIFAIAIIHTFLVGKIELLAYKFKKNTLLFHFFNLMGEVEIVFGFWSFIFLIIFAFFKGSTPAIGYLESLNFTEAIFVFVIMCMAATRPVVYFVEKLIFVASRVLPFNERMSFYIAALIIGPTYRLSDHRTGSYDGDSNGFT